MDGSGSGAAAIRWFHSHGFCGGDTRLRDVGFTRVETVLNPNNVPRWRNPGLYWRHSRAVTHAWR